MPNLKLNKKESKLKLGKTGNVDYLTNGQHYLLRIDGQEHQILLNIKKTLFQQNKQQEL